jgi:putative methionine/alanine importer small subunit
VRFPPDATPGEISHLFGSPQRAGAPVFRHGGRIGQAVSAIVMMIIGIGIVRGGLVAAIVLLTRHPDERAP